MARGINKVIIVGNCGQDPETRYMPSGGAVTNLSLATSESWKDKNTGDQQERTEWHRVVFFNRLAEIVEQYVKKGSKVYIEGSLRTRKWQGQDGQDRYTTEIVASEMQMLDSRGGQGQGGYDQSQPDYAQSQPQQAQQNQAAPKQTAAPAAAPAQGMGFDDDIPFQKAEFKLTYLESFMTIKVGDKIPEGTLAVMGAEGPAGITTADIFAGKKVVLVAVPGAFTPTCSVAHMPGFVVKYDEIIAKGVDTVACLSVNDAFVMNAWKDASNAENILMLADGNCTFTASLGLELDGTGFGMGMRSKRFAIIVNDGVVELLNVDESGFELSSAEAVLEAL